MKEGDFFIGFIGNTFVHGRIRTIFLVKWYFFLCQNKLDGYYASHIDKYGYDFICLVYYKDVEIKDNFIKSKPSSSEFIFLLIYQA